MFVLTLCLTFTIIAWADKVYFINDEGWSTVKAYYWGGNTGTVSWPGVDMDAENMVCSKGAVYSKDVPAGMTNIIFNCGGDACKTADLDLDASKPYWYQETAYASLADIEAIAEPEVPDDYVSAVPSECPDVMLQAFYWDSYQNKGYGDTKWATLKNQVGEITTYFSLVWLPPSSDAGDKGGLGYHPKQYGVQSSKLGNQMELRNLISAFHDNNTKVIADIVINHAGNRSSWCDFYTQSFGAYGNFSPTEAWICKTDEVNTTTDSSVGSCKGKATGATDDGYGSEANYPSARDWDHTNVQVQNMCKAYLQWLKNKIGYDGWRYDYCKGFKTTHINDYNVASSPYLSVMEYWDGNIANLKSRIDQASKNTMTFDFAMRYDAFRDGIRAKNYAKLKNAGLRSRGYSKYAVTFVDNHDTFQRSGTHDSPDIGNKKDGSSINDAALILQANAYILAMPGIPCVFYPHWIKYKAEIKEMVKARWIAGVHSESTVTSEESGSNYYKATIVGKTGEIRLLLGSASGFDQTPAGYTRAYSGNNVGFYYKGTGAWPRGGASAVEEVEQDHEKLQLDFNQLMYNILGQQVDASYKGIVIQNGHKFMLR